MMPQLLRDREPLPREVAQLEVGAPLACRHQCDTIEGWLVDEWEAELPPEPPGPPLPNGSWEIARRLLGSYRFIDPSIISAVYYPDDPIDPPIRLLHIRFFLFAFFLPLRLGDEISESQASEQGPVHLWGFNYQALEGHFERGQMLFDIAKWERTGKVSFRLHVYSRMGHISNPFFNIGYKLVGRWQQKRYTWYALQRMQRLVTHHLATTGNEPFPIPDGPPLLPASSDGRARRKMKKLHEQLRRYQKAASVG